MNDTTNTQAAEVAAPAVPEGYVLAKQSMFFRAVKLTDTDRHAKLVEKAGAAKIVLVKELTEED